MNVGEVQRELAREYLSVMKDRDYSHRPSCIIFSGVPGSGKTTLARRLAQDLKAQYIRHDDIRSLARKHGYDLEKLTISSISRIVMNTIMEQDANKLVIVDASLDRTWPLFFEHTTEHGAMPIIIRLEVPREIIEERIAARSNDDFGNVTDLDKFFEQFENSKQHVRATMTLGSDYNYDETLSQLTQLVG